MRRVFYGFGIFMFLFLLTSAVYYSRQVRILRAQVQELETEEGDDPQNVNAGTSDQGYYLKEDGEYVCVYRGDGATVYEPTGISLDSLPDELREEIRQGKYMESEVELYSFLENYSS